jgi:membrane-associated phospholipid phosphatase
MPSLHTAFATLVAIFIAARLRSKWRYLLVLYPIAMGFTLVYCGEHYVLDLVAGVVYALATHLALNAWEARRAARRDGRGPSPQPAVPEPPGELEPLTDARGEVGAKVP